MVTLLKNTSQVIKEINPNIRIPHITGYPATALKEFEEPNLPYSLLKKPFTIRELMEKMMDFT